MPCHTNNCNQNKNAGAQNMRTPNGAPPVQNANAANMRAPMNGRMPMNGRAPMNGQVPMTAFPAQPGVGVPPPATTAVTTAMPMFPGPDAPSTIQSPYYTAGFLKQFIGRNMRVEFLIGTNGPLVDRIGTLQDVGASYIVLEPYLSDDLLMADLYSIKFVTIYD